MLSIYAATTAFAGPAPMARSAVQPVMQEKSAAIPFLKKPPALDGSMPGGTHTIPHTPARRTIGGREAVNVAWNG